MTTTPTTGQLPGPGRNTDFLIAEKMGYSPRQPDPETYLRSYDFIYWDNKQRDYLEIPKFSTDMNQALELIRKLAEDDIKISIGSTLENTFEVNAWKWDDARLDELELYSVIHENPAYAVCVAFLAVYRG